MPKEAIDPTATFERPGIQVESNTACRPQVCCYANVRDVGFFETHEFYRTDITILRELGYNVFVTNSVRRLVMQSSDIYFAWWFGYGIFPALIGWFRRRPVVVSGVLHTRDGGGLKAWPALKRWTMRLTLLLADCSIVCSLGEYERLDGFQPRHCKIVPLSIDMATYAWAEDTRDLQRKSNVLMVTQLNRDNVERKMVAQAIRAFAEFAKTRPDFKLQICGAIGDGIDIVHAAIAEAGIEQQVEILGRVSIDRKVQLLSAAFAYLQPTICEGFGLAIGEALACGTPVVTSPEKCVVGTYGNAVRYGANEMELTQRLEELASDLDQYQIQQHRGFEYVQRYSLANRREHFRSILDGLRR